MDTQHNTGGRFGSASDAFVELDDDLLGVTRREQPVAQPTSRAKSPRKTSTPVRATQHAGQTRVYVGVPDDVRHAAPQLAAQTGRTVADLLILGTQLELPYGTAPKDDVPEGLPIGRPRAIEPRLTNLAVRVTPAQHQWLTAKAEEVGATSLRQYAGGALTAYVRQHTATQD